MSLSSKEGGDPGQTGLRLGRRFPSNLCPSREKIPHILEATTRGGAAARSATRAGPAWPDRGFRRVGVGHLEFLAQACQLGFEFLLRLGVFRPAVHALQLPRVLR